MNMRQQRQVAPCEIVSSVSHMHLFFYGGWPGLADIAEASLGFLRFL